MKHRIAFINLPLLAVFLVLASTALASGTWYVNGVSGSDGNACTSPTTACKTIGHAVSLASSGDSIMVAAATYTENLTIGISLKILGSGVATTIIDGGGVGTVVTIPTYGIHVTLSRVAIRNGHARIGGGISNNATLIINNSTISGNSASGPGHHAGGGIFNYGTLTINNSTISGNGVNPGFGGGIFNAYLGPVTINNSTISGNSAGAGGGIYNALGTLTISNSTVSGNSAFAGVGGIFNSSGLTALLRNSIVANNLSGGNCIGTMTSKGYNLSSDGTCNFNGTGDLNNTDPKLGPLQNNGGPTPTQALLSGSLAIDAGNPSGCTDGKGHLLKTDQRGMPRPDREDAGGCDMGAYEEQSQPKCIPLGDPCFAFGPKCCPAFPRHTFCSSKTGYGYCLETLEKRGLGISLDH